jgi:penicillin-binding protein 2
MYAAIANGGTIWKPTIAKAIVKSNGTVVKKFSPESLGDIGVDPVTLKLLQESLHEVTLTGTSAGVFSGFPVQTSGKTGTAQVFGRNPNGTLKSDTSWYAAYAPTQNPRYAVVMMVSQGGFGASTSGIGVKNIFEALFGVQGKPPTKLPRISPATKAKPSILNPGKAVSASPTPKAAVKR